MLPYAVSSKAGRRSKRRQVSINSEKKNIPFHHRFVADFKENFHMFQALMEMFGSQTALLASRLGSELPRQGFKMIWSQV